MTPKPNDRTADPSAPIPKNVSFNTPNGQKEDIAFPYMVRFTSNAGKLTKETATIAPSIDLGPACRGYRFVDWLSSSINQPFELRKPSSANAATTESDAEVDAGNVLTTDFLSSHIEATHLTPHEWEAACDFFGFDKDELDSRSCV